MYVTGVKIHSQQSTTFSPTKTDTKYFKKIYFNPLISSHTQKDVIRSWLHVYLPFSGHPLENRQTDEINLYYRRHFLCFPSVLAVLLFSDILSSFKVTPFNWITCTCRILLPSFCPICPLRPACSAVHSGRREGCQDSLRTILKICNNKTVF